ncbi:FAD-binding oxidoreductase [Candidatus Nomurabacteria bacterium]|nr:FAD-binding oxidoreductase [Candidatus Nomurabacteria bacterium]
MSLADDLSKVIKGEVLADNETLSKYSHDASLFEVRPQIVAFPKDTEDVSKIVSFVNENKKNYKNLSITGRSAGTDMSGGAINEGIILDFTRYFKKEDISVKDLRAIVGPGIFFRTFEKDTLPQHISMPVYPASKSLAALGGMIMNNCGGEKTLRYGQIRNFVLGLKMVLANGKEYRFKKLNREELEKKKSQTDFEGETYRQMFDLIDKNYDLIQKAKPKVTKNSSGYALWDVYNREAGTFDLTQLFVGSQGTLGLLTEAEMRLVESNDHEKLVAVFLDNWNDLPILVNELLPLKLESMETFDDTTLKLGLRFMPEVAKKVGMNFLSFAWKFLPEVFIGIRMMGLPKLIVLLEISEKTEAAMDNKVKVIKEVLDKQKLLYRVSRDHEDAEKYWVMRRESFNLLRQKVKGKKTAPFIDDICVTPDKLPEFLPRFLAILKEHDVKVNIAGHAGSGNLHIIPLMELDKKEERDKIRIVADKVYKLVIEYGGTITAEHNDGIVRTPYLEEMFGKEVYRLFETVKDIFDPNNIFNPGKKVGGSKEYMEKHITRM